MSTTPKLTVTVVSVILIFDLTNFVHKLMFVSLNTHLLSVDLINRSSVSSACQ